jgi:hypothetical protein
LLQLPSNVGGTQTVAALPALHFSEQYDCEPPTKHTLLVQSASALHAAPRSFFPPLVPESCPASAPPDDDDDEDELVLPPELPPPELELLPPLLDVDPDEPFGSFPSWLCPSLVGAVASLPLHARMTDDASAMATKKMLRMCGAHRRNRSARARFARCGIRRSRRPR